MVCRVVYWRRVQEAGQCKWMVKKVDMGSQANDIDVAKLR